MQRWRDLVAALLGHGRAGAGLLGAAVWLSKCDRVIATEVGQVGVPGPAVYVFGPARIGKSTVCRRIARETGWRHVDLDGYTFSLLGGEAPGRLHLWCLKIFFRKLARAAPGGVCVDSEALRWIFLDDPQFLLREVVAAALVPMSSRAACPERLEALRVHRATGACWTIERISDAGLPAYAALIVRRCREVEQASATAGLRPVFVEPADFAEDMRTVAAEVRARVVPAPPSGAAPVAGLAAGQAAGQA